MIIASKYDIGQYVFLLVSNKVYKSKIIDIEYASGNIRYVFIDKDLFNDTPEAFGGRIIKKEKDVSYDVDKLLNSIEVIYPSNFGK